VRERSTAVSDEAALFDQRPREFLGPDENVCANAATDPFGELGSRPVGHVDRVTALALEHRHELDQGLFTRHRADHDEFPVLRLG
jgi:hypothetical protein